MDLFLIRHGYAEPFGHGGHSDQERALTPLGRSLLAKAAPEMRRRGVAPAVILSSPFRRAIETAELLLTELVPAGGLRIIAELASGASPETLLEIAGRHQPLGPVLLVGHNPEIDAAVRWLAAEASTPVHPMRPSTLAWFREARLPPSRGIRLEAQWDVETLAGTESNGA